MDSNNSPDGKQAAAFQIPEELAQRFKAKTSGLDPFWLRTFYRALGGEPLDVDDVELLRTFHRDVGIKPETVTRLAPAYNDALVWFEKRVGRGAAAGSAASGDVRYAKRLMKPESLDRAIEAIEPNGLRRVVIKRLAHELRGKRLPIGDEAEELRRRFGLSTEVLAGAYRTYELALLHHQNSSQWRQWEHGARRKPAAQRVVLTFPRALALRLPFIWNHRWHEDEGIYGTDIWGELRCNVPLRPMAVGLIGFLFGILTDPEAAGEMAYVDDDGHIYFSKGFAYQVLGPVAQDREPGGGGHALVDHALDQVDRMQISGSVFDNKEIRNDDRTPDMAIPCAPFALAKAVDAGDGFEYVPLSDPRDVSKRTQKPFRATVHHYWRLHVGKKGGRGNRVYVNASVWRMLTPAGRAMLLEVRARRPQTDRYESRPHVDLFAGQPWKLRFGLHDQSDDVCEQRILAALHDLYRVDEKCRGYAPPWLRYKNSTAKLYRVFVNPGASGVRAQLIPRLRRADFLAQLLVAADTGDWPGLTGVAGPNAPPDTS